jgi:hypothetical protein
MGRRLFVGNLNFKTTSEDLKELFGSAGNCEWATVMMDRVTGKSRGFGFVEMATDEEAQKAISQLNGQDLQGRNLNINEARERTAGGGGGGAPREYSGGGGGGYAGSGGGGGGYSGGGGGDYGGGSGGGYGGGGGYSGGGGGGFGGGGSRGGFGGDSYGNQGGGGFGGGGFGGDFGGGFGAGGNTPKRKEGGSRRGLRAKKRSL